MNSEPKFTDYINKIYGKSGYFDKYGGSFTIMLITLITFFVIISYYYVMAQADPIKKDWNNQKCNPKVIPFAGLINAPAGEDKFKYTLNNFSGCLFNILTGIVRRFTDPVVALTGVVTNLFSIISGMVNMVRKMVEYIRAKIMRYFKLIADKLNSVIIPLRVLIIKMKSLMERIKGTLIAAIYTVIGSYYTLEAAMGALTHLIFRMLGIFLAMILIMWIIPWTWPAAAVATGIYVILGIFALIIGIWMSVIFDVVLIDWCFDEDTIIELEKGEVKIKDIKVGSKLKDGSIVTSKFTISNRNEEMYKIGNIIVSGSHYIKDEKDYFIRVKKYKNAIKIDNYNKEKIYCINTSSKTIKIGDITFLDWDDIMEIDILKLKNNNHLEKNETKSNINTNLEGGLDENTELELESGHSVKIKNIEINDILKYGEIVLAKVEIDASNMKNIKKINYNGNEIIGSNILFKENLGIKHSNDINGENVNRKKLYHLITDKGLIYINGFTIFDYEGNLEQILDIYENEKKN